MHLHEIVVPSAFIALLFGAGCGDDGAAGNTQSGGGGSGASAAGGSGANGGGGAGGAGGGGGGTGPVEVADYEQVCIERAHDNCFYVSSSGNYPAGTDGKHLTMPEVSSHAFTPGAIILFARGDTWRQESGSDLISVSSSGTMEDPIVFGAYGTGAKPRFLGSIQATSWTNVSGNVWQSATNIPDNPQDIDSGAEVFFERSDGSAVFGHYEGSAAALDQEGDWTYGGGQITVFATSNPDTLYASVEVPQAQRLIALDNQEHIAFDSLTLRYMVNAGFYDEYANGMALQGLTVTNGEIAYIGVKGSTSAYGLSLDRSNVRIAGCVIHDCGRRSVSLVLYKTAPSQIRDVLIENDHFYNGYHTTGVDIESNEAASGGHVIEDIVIRNNLFEGDPTYVIGGDNPSSNHIFINQDPGSILRNIYIHNNLFTFAHGSGIKISRGEGYFIHNNTFFGFNPSYPNFQAHIFGGNESSSTVIVNNVFYSDATDNTFACIEYGAGQQGQYTIDRNLYFAASYDHARLLWVDGGTSWFFDDDWDGYRSATGFDENSPAPDDPKFAGPPSNLKPLDGSPAIGVGVPVDWIQTDYLGEPVTSPPDLGAIQH